MCVWPRFPALVIFDTKHKYLLDLYSLFTMTSYMGNMMKPIVKLRSNLPSYLKENTLQNFTYVIIRMTLHYKKKK